MSEHLKSRSEIKRMVELDPHAVIKEIEGLRAKLSVARDALERIAQRGLWHGGAGVCEIADVAITSIDASKLLEGE